MFDDVDLTLVLTRSILPNHSPEMPEGELKIDMTQARSRSQECNPPSTDLSVESSP